MLTPAPRIEDRKLQLARVNQMAWFVIALFVVLMGRLWYLQIVRGQELLGRSEANRVKLLRTRAPRGTILDRKGRILATSRPQFVVLATPEKLREDKEALHTLCGVLEISAGELESIIKKGQGRPGSPTRVAMDVPLPVVARIGELRMKLPGVSVELDQIRNYPDGGAVAHIMGYLGEIDREELDESDRTRKGYRPGDYVGKSGLEKHYEEILRGADGGKQIEVNAFGRVVRILGEKESVPGRTLKLAIDKDLQIAAHRAFGRQVGAAVAVDPRTGGVLAMVSSPVYDPNVFAKRLKSADWEKITSNRAHPLQNRCVYNVYPPGSTFKPMMAIAGLTRDPDISRMTVGCPGVFHMGRARFGCWKVHGGVDFTRALADSCDVWYYNLARRTGIEHMAEIARDFGIGSATGIDLPHESRRKDGGVGNMPDPAWKKRRYHERWYPGETVICAIGQGYVQASPLQMALACAGVANSGPVPRPHLVDEILRPNGSRARLIEPAVKHRVEAPAEYFSMVKSGMRAAVTSGTGKVCDMKDVAVCGKTGTAQDPPRPSHGWFICFAPMENPTIAVAAIVEGGRHGATTAAPICRAILDVYFGKKKPQEIAQGSARASGD